MVDAADAAAGDADDDAATTADSHRRQLPINRSAGAGSIHQHYHETAVAAADAYAAAAAAADTVMRMLPHMVLNVCSSLQVNAHMSSL